jgi:hypothetical protein
MYPRAVDIFAYQIHNTFFNPWTTYKPFTRVAFKHFLTNFYPLLWEKTLKNNLPMKTRMDRWSRKVNY